jgi:hypothetical protein
MALDIDDVPAASEYLLARGVNLEQLLAATDRVEIVSGRAGRGKLLFKLPTSLAECPQTLQVKNGDGEMILEFRCADANGNSVQDVLPPSIHPDTGMPYQWVGDWRNPPTIPATLLSLWQNELKKKLKAGAPAPPAALSTPPPGFVPPLVLNPDFAPLEEGLFGLTVLESALDHVSPDVAYDQWRNIVWAIMSTGWKCAPQIVHGWSKLAPRRYDSAAVDGLIRSFDPTRGVTIATLFHFAKQRGWIMPQQFPLAVVPAVPQPPNVSAAASVPTSLMDLPCLLPAALAVQEVNRFIGFAHDWGGKPTYFRLDSDGKVHACKRDEMRSLLANRFVDNGAGGRKPLFNTWEASPSRHTVARVVYDPAGGALNAKNELILNLWRGFARTPHPGSWDLIGQHLLRVVCSGNVSHFAYLLAWMAHLIQRPWEAPGVVVVLRSQREGTGKTTVLGWLHAMLGIHALMLADPAHLLGRFNTHLETISFMGLNELGWAGDKQAAAKLKSIITDPTITIERKHGGVYSVPNVLHVMATSNSDWVVPAGDGARRYFVLDVDPSRAGDHAYFDALYHEADNGGVEAFMDYLLRFNLDLVDLRKAPVTDALRQQQERSLPLQARWALDLADRADSSGTAGMITFGRTVLTRKLYDDYVAFATSRRAYPLEAPVFGRWLTKIGLVEGRSSTQRQRILPAATEFARIVRKNSGVHE